MLFPDLEPATWYVLRITAHNNAGFNVAEYEFATLTMTGGTYTIYYVRYGKYNIQNFTKLSFVFFTFCSFSYIIYLVHNLSKYI